MEKTPLEYDVSGKEDLQDTVQQYMSLNIQSELQQNGLYQSIYMLDWPSQIPDLNRIKNVWRTLKVIFRDVCSTLTKLEVFRSKEWVIKECQDIQKLPSYILG